jgi:tetratricopeptide (TPR) repeat protein
MYFVPGPLVYVTKQPGTMSASLSEGTGYYAQGFIDALQRRCYCFEAVDKNGGRQWWLAGAHYRLGRVFWEAGERSSAAAKFREALRCDPWHLGALLYGWATAHPNFARAFRALRLIKRRASRILQRIGVAENRWG